jgi:hypothetical protein
MRREFSFSPLRSLRNAKTFSAAGNNEFDITPFIALRATILVFLSDLSGEKISFLS